MTAHAATHLFNAGKVVISRCSRTLSKLYSAFLQDMRAKGATAGWGTERRQQLRSGGHWKAEQQRPAPWNAALQV